MHPNIRLYSISFSLSRNFRILVYTNELKSWEFGKADAADLRQRSGAEAAQLE